MLSLTMKVSPLCNIVLKHQSAYKQVVHTNTLYTHRLPLKDKHLPGVATNCNVEHCFNSAVTEQVPRCSIFTQEPGTLAHQRDDLLPTASVRREEDIKTELYERWGWLRSFAASASL